MNITKVIFFKLPRKIEVRIRTSKLSRRCHYIIHKVYRIKGKNRLNHLNNMIEMAKPNLILDVGANVGQFITDLEITGYKEKIIALEPMAEAFKNLIKIQSKNKNLILENKALVNSAEKSIKIYQSSNLEMSSSLLEPTKNYGILDSKTTFKESVISALSVTDLVLKYPEIKDSRILIKIDVQGYEMEIIQSIIKEGIEISAIIVETSLIPLYNESASFLETMEGLKKLSQQIIDVNVISYSKIHKSWQYCDIYAVNTKIMNLDE